jgi:8-oxo-dGTP pyrophosphatase MutT (NUDIX family)
MNFEPQKFFIGLMEFFSILLPGALLTYLLMVDFGPIVLGTKKYEALSGAEGWAVFFATSYLFGHLVFLLGSWWLDRLYDWFRRYTLNTQINLLARRDKLLPWLMRALIWLVFGRERNLAVDRAGKIKQKALEPLEGKDAINTFQWCKAVLNVESQDSLAVVQRFEADSKFFRCLVIVLIVLVGMWICQQKWELVAVGIALLPLALWRYMEQRYKSTNQAYWSVITLTARGGKVVFDKAAPADNGLTHAGGIVFRMRGGEAQYLLVEATRDPDQWVLPKGHIEDGEHPRETAVREVHEETGVWARIRSDLGRVSFFVNGKPGFMQCYLMELAGHGERQEKLREHRWLSHSEAMTLANYLETRESLMSAEQQVKQRYPPRKTR